MKKLSFLVIILIFFSAILLLIFPFKDNLTNRYYCSSDAHCVQEQCCHATSCININFKPNCEEIMCTEECVPNTLDCGLGRCVCQNHECKAVLE